MSTLPVYNPRVPFIGHIPGGLKPNLMVRMRGKITKRNGRCMINFIRMPALESDQDIQLHISIRLDEHCMVRNSFQNRSWQNEERSGAFRIAWNETFEITILAEFECYKIAVNGVHVSEFQHRLPLHLVQYMNVKGVATIEHILLEQNVNSSQIFVPASQYGIATNSSAVPAYTEMASAPGFAGYPQQPPTNRYNQPPWGNNRF